MSLAIRWRLTIWIALAFALSLAAVFVSVRIVVSEILDDDIEQDLVRNFNELEGRVLIRGQSQLALSGLVDEFPFPVAVLEPDGRLIAANTEADVNAMELSAEEVTKVAAGTDMRRDIEINGESFRVISGRVSLGQNSVILQVGRSTQAVEDVMSALTTILVGGGLIALLGVLGAAYFLARSALLPVDQITRLAAEIEASDLTRRIGARGKPAEVQRLADTFDAMLARLENAFAQQRNFVMDVSHELRTPLTALLMNIGVMRRNKDLTPELREEIDNLALEVGRLVRLSSNLLYMAHAEADREVARRPVALDELCLEVVHQVRDVRRGVSLRFLHEDQVSVSGDRDLLKQLFLNLVDNAIKYSPENGEVTVSLARRNGVAEVAVRDQGPGIPEDQRERIFERFYRIKEKGARTVSGAGIGLAISRWIVNAHGGTLRVEDAEGGGSKFVVSIPLGPEAPDEG